jgi:hypothetical protein
MGLAERTLTLSQRKGARPRNKPPIKQHSENSTTKQNGWWATELILEPEDKPHLTEGGDD